MRSGDKTCASLIPSSEISMAANLVFLVAWDVPSYGQLVAMVINVHPCHGDCRQGQCWLLSTHFVEPVPLVLPGSVLLIAVREGCTCMQGHFLSKFPSLPKASPPSAPTSSFLPSLLPLFFALLPPSSLYSLLFSPSLPLHSS